ncbi:unnamed protein product [Rhizophagus irregularis]|nr:unnamed protein product [Rhizophagus irregularis]
MFYNFLELDELYFTDRYRTFSFGLRTLTSRIPATLGSSFILNFLNSGRYDRYQNHFRDLSCTSWTRRLVSYGSVRYFGLILGFEGFY